MDQLPTSTVISRCFWMILIYYVFMVMAGGFVPFDSYYQVGPFSYHIVRTIPNQDWLILSAVVSLVQLVAFTYAVNEAIVKKV